MNHTAFAVKTNYQLEKEKQEIENKQAQVNSEINSTKSELVKIQNQQEDIQNKKKELDFAIAETSGKIRDKEADIEKTGKEIERINKEIDVLEEQIKKRDKLLRERMRSLQANGGMVSYLDVILAAENLNDFLSRLYAISTFVQADRGLIEQHQEDVTALEKSEMEVKELLAEQKNQLTELGKLKDKFKTQMAQADELMAQLEIKAEEAHEELIAQEEQEAFLADQNKAIQREIEEWEREQREIEEAKKRGEYVPPPSNGTFMNPTTGRLTSTMGMRWGSMHYGIDIGKGGRSGNVPIVAAASGTVVRSNYSNGFGNVVMITHYINGRVMTTVYAHLQERFVSNNQRVEQGQLIGYMGSTGDSTGPHLHFEIYDGPFTPAQYSGGHSNAVNPLNYVSFN